MLATKIPSFFKQRRDFLMKKHPGALFLFLSHPEFIRNSDVHHPYRQDSNFYYLTGFEEPNAALLLVPSSQGDYKTIFFVQPRDPDKELWDGARYGIEGAQNVFGADTAYPYSQLMTVLADQLKACTRIFYRLGLNSNQDTTIIQLLENARRGWGRTGKGLPSIEDPLIPVGEMRLFKTAEELVLHRKACQISAEAHCDAMRATRPNMNESDIEALIDYSFRKGGCKRLGYSSIVAGGQNAACLHYHENQDPLKSGDLLLIDAGGEYQYYSADITRTFPIGPTFSPAQAQVYDLVLKAQLAGIAMTRPGVTLPAIHERVTQTLLDGFLSLGLLKGNPKDLIASGEYKRFYPHNTSHWLGMDVHDAGLYYLNGEPRRLEPGMVFTIEPGFYIQPHDTEAAARYQSLGIRIEDDILVTQTGCEVMTHSVPKEREAIEEMRLVNHPL